MALAPQRIRLRKANGLRYPLLHARSIPVPDFASAPQRSRRHLPGHVCEGVLGLCDPPEADAYVHPSACSVGEALTRFPPRGVKTEIVERQRTGVCPTSRAFRFPEQGLHTTAWNHHLDYFQGVRRWWGIEWRRVNYKRSKPKR